MKNINIYTASNIFKIFDFLSRKNNKQKMKFVAVLLLCVASACAAPSVQQLVQVGQQVASIVQNLIQNGAAGLVQAILQHIPIQQLNLQAIFQTIQSQLASFAQQAQAIIASIINGRSTRFLGALIDAGLNIVQQVSQQIVNEALTSLNGAVEGIISGINGIGKRNVDARFLSGLFNQVVDSVSGHISNIGSAIGNVVTGVIETAQPHVDNLLTEFQGHGENAVQSLVNAIAGINQGIGY